MPLTIGMASSHFPSLFQDTYAGWQWYWKLLSGDVQQPPEAAGEDAACIADWVRRRGVAFGRLRERLAADRVDALIVIAGDQDEWFSPAHSPNMLIYSGTGDVTGFHNYGHADVDPPLVPWEHPQRFGLRVKVDAALATALQASLIAAGFDISISKSISQHGRPERGAPHALVRTLPLITPEFDIPIVPVMIKTIERSPAVLTGARCISLGRAIAKFCATQSKRVAIYGSGGMSHDPQGPRSGWVDEPLDRWVLRCMEAADLERLSRLFSFRSSTTDSGTGELRCWLVAAGAMGDTKAAVIDYFPARKATAGCGWVLWETS